MNDIRVGIVKHEMRVSAAHPPLVRAGVEVLMGSRRDVGRAILDRYTRQPIRWSQLAMLWQRLLQNLTFNSIFSPTHVYGSPRLSLTVMNWLPPDRSSVLMKRQEASTLGVKTGNLIDQRQFVQTGFPQPSQPSFILNSPTLIHWFQGQSQSQAFDRLPLLQKLIYQTQQLEALTSTEPENSVAGARSRLPMLQFVHQLISQEERVEPTAPGLVWPTVGQSLQQPITPEMEATAPVRRAIAAVPPIARVFKRSAPLLQDDQGLPFATTPPTHAQGSASATRSHFQRKQANNSTEESIDISRLTDQVVQAIDRRMIAQRERMGRF